MVSTISIDVALARLVHGLAHLASAPPTLGLLAANFRAADQAFDRFSRAIESISDPATDLRARTHEAYLAALLLAKTLAALIANDRSLARCVHTTIKMLDLLDRLSTPGHRALRRALVGDLEAPPVAVAVC
jgi:hypothetical protein